MATWNEFETDAPDIAAAGKQLLYQFGVGLAFLATLRKDGAPRLHPICPTIVDGHLYALIGRLPSAPISGATAATRSTPSRRSKLTTNFS